MKTENEILKLRNKLLKTFRESKTLTPASRVELMRTLDLMHWILNIDLEKENRSMWRKQRAKTHENRKRNKRTQKHVS